MSYLALYRRFRPQVFEDLIGQETVVQALVNQIKTDKVGHAYLFCGARGTGKTTAAKIFAKAINCEKKDGSPCGECSVCQKLNDPNSLDIVEMDAASNNKVENVREIREKVQYPPVSGRYKVYIIDEVHMLTTEAFNALLKTLEEPPKHAVFILATTEPHKLPATILSRCMRFDFKLISVQKIASLISKIFDEVGKEYDSEAITCIARAGEGSVRDALSVADICLSYNNKKLTYNDVIDVLGASNRLKTAELIKYIFTQNTGSALKLCDELLSLGKNVGMLIKDILSFLREIMIVKTCKSANDILSLPSEDISLLEEIAKLTDNNGILRTVEIFSKTENDIKYSTHAKIVFETAIVKATNQSQDYNIDALMSRISKLESAVSGGSTLVGSQKTEVVVKEKVVDNEKVDKLIERINALEKKCVELENKTTVVESKPIVERQPVKKVIVTEEFNDSDIPPIDDSFDFSAVEKVERSEKVQPTIAVSQETFIEEKSVEKIDSVVVDKAVDQDGGEEKPFSTVPDRRIWGTLIKKLRETGNTMLWVMCQDFESSVQNGELKIFVTTAREKESITKEPNFTNLKNVLKTICSYKISVLVKGEKVDEFDSDIEKMKVDFDKLDIED